MIVYAIPFRSKATTNDWNHCVDCLDRTLTSIFNPLNQAPFSCVVACNEIPERLRAKYDKRLKWITLDLPVPCSKIEMYRDKFWKLTAIGVYIRGLLENESNPNAGIYVMPVDADDLLHYKIPQWCQDHPNENGFVSQDGYVWIEGKSYFRIYPQMHTYCGSCNIIKMYREDLPERMPYPETFCHDQKVAAILNQKYPLRFDHNIVVDKYQKMGRAFSLLPFRSTVYVRGTGDNISCIPTNAETASHQSSRFHPVAFLRSLNIFRIKPINRHIKQEFGMT